MCDNEALYKQSLRSLRNDHVPIMNTRTCLYTWYLKDNNNNKKIRTFIFERRRCL